MMITGQACRRISGAVRELQNPRSSERWGTWARTFVPGQIRDDIPYDVAAIALEALTAAERRIEDQLRQAALDEGQEADLLNDLGYIKAIEQALQNEGIGR
jgi:hypothetical protein